MKSKLLAATCMSCIIVASGCLSQTTPSTTDTQTDTISQTNTNSQTNTDVQTDLSPIANFSFNIDGQKVQFEDLSANLDNPSHSYNWNFGNGQTSTDQTPLITFTPGTYNVSLTVSDDSNQSVFSSVVYIAPPLTNLTPIANFEYTINEQQVTFRDLSSNLDNDTHFYSWNFGNGQTSDEIAPSINFQPGTFSVSLTIFDGTNTDSFTQSITIDETDINLAPIAAFDFAINGQQVQFSDRSTNLDDVNHSYSWMFSDGQTSSAASPIMTFNSESITATLTVDDGSSSSSFDQTFAMVIAPGNIAPTANFNYSINEQQVQFTDLSSDVDGNIQSYDWDFGNNLNSIQASPTTTYAPGTYTVKLTVSDGELSSFHSQIIVIEPTELPQMFTIEAENYSNATGEVNLENAGTTVGFFKNDDHIIYSDVNLTDVTTITTNFATMTGEGSIEFRAGGVEGTLVAVARLSGTGDWQTYIDTQVVVINPVEGITDLYVVGIEPNDNYIANFDFFTLNRGDINDTGNGITTIQEEQSGYCFADGVIENDHGGEGSGYTNINNSVDAEIKWEIQASQAGVYQLNIRYANGSDASRPGTLTINDVADQTVEFATTSLWTTWADQTVSVAMSQGSNIINLSSNLATGMPNIDSLTIIGDGITTVDCKVEPPVVEPPVEPPVTPPTAGQIKITDLPIGWASQAGGTTGGGTDLSKAVTVSNMSDLKNAVKGNSAKIVLVKPGTYSGELEPGANTTMIGTGPGVIIKGNVNISGSDKNNIIMRNFSVRGNKCNSYDDCKDGSDGFYIGNGAHHVWIDHLDVADGQDGNFDITKAADYITVSWSKFHYTYEKEHRFSNLIAGSDKETQSEGKLRITYMNSWWGNLVEQRQPRGRFGKIHLLNNLFDSQLTNQIVHGPGIKMSMVIEGNYYDLPSNVNTIKASYGTPDGWNAFNNKGTAKSMNTTSGNAFTVPYSYTPMNADSVPAAIRSTDCGAGNTCSFP